MREMFNKDFLKLNVNECLLAYFVSHHFTRIHIQTPVYLFHTQDKSTWSFPQLGVSKNRGVSPQIIHFNRVFNYKPSMLGVFPLFLVQHPIALKIRKKKTYPSWKRTEHNIPRPSYRAVSSRWIFRFLPVKGGEM